MFYYRKHDSNSNTVNKFWWVFLGILIFALGLAAGAWRYGQAEQAMARPYEAALGQQFSFTGVIVREPDERVDRARLTVRAEETGALILMSVALQPKFHYGDRLALKGQLVAPRNFITESGREFDYINYLAKEGIFYQLLNPEVKLISSGAGSAILGAILQGKAFLLDRLKQFLPEPEVSLLGGLILGAKQSLGEDLLADFRRTGVIHIVVLSGYNLAIFARAVMLGVTFLPLPFRLPLGAAAVLALTLAAGAGAATVRAALMAGAALVAQFTGRLYQAARALGLAVLVMVWWKPLILVYDLGFQLSVLSTLGLIFLSPLVARRLLFLPQRWGMRELASATIAAQIAVLPWLLYKVGELPLFALPANLLIGLLLPATMALGAATIFASFLGRPLAIILGYATYLLLASELAIVDWLARIPFSALTFFAFPWWLVVLLYLLIVMITIRWRNYDARIQKS